MRNQPAYEKDAFLRDSEFAERSSIVAELESHQTVGLPW
jgi:hypothetical protein